MEDNYDGFTFKMKAVWLIIVAFLLISYEGNAQIDYSELPKTNFNLFQEITAKSLNELADAITIIGKDKIFKISVNDTTEKKEFFINELKQKFQNVKFIYEISDSVDFEIMFSNIDFKTKYSYLKTKRLFGDEYLNRGLIVLYSYSVPAKDVIDRKVSKSYNDEIKADRIEYIENGNYAFLKSVLPDKPFFKKIIVPAVIVAVSAIATILFFTIRSK